MALVHNWVPHRAEGRIDAHTQAQGERISRVLGQELSAGRRVAAMIGSFHTVAPLAPESGPLSAVGPNAMDYLVRYTFAQLDSCSDYPTGIRDPSWQQAVFTSELTPGSLRNEATRLITEITRQLRAAGYSTDPGEAAEATRITLDLAALRELMAPSHWELIRTATTVLAQREALGWGRVVTGALEQVPIEGRSNQVVPGTPTLVLRVNTLAELETLRIPLEKNGQLYLEPLRSPRDLHCHVLLMRLFIGDITFASPVNQDLSRRAEMVGLSWDLRWSTATEVSIELAASHGLTPGQAVVTMLLTWEVGTPQEAMALLTEAVGCALESTMERASRLVVPLAGWVGFTDVVALSVALAEVALSRIPGTSLLSEQQRVRAIKLRDEFTSTAVRGLHGIRDPDDPESARAPAVFAAQGGSHAPSLGHALG